MLSIKKKNKLSALLKRLGDTSGDNVVIDNLNDKIDHVMDLIPSPFDPRSLENKIKELMEVVYGHAHILKNISEDILKFEQEINKPNKDISRIENNLLKFTEKFSEDIQKMTKDIRSIPRGGSMPP